ncbi:hypothetical protein C8R11_103132 [Nitrosomonas aestuarii]|nr:hypothetical protein C8R11_103132 [Nitrosomonas aestuarii]
MLESKGTDSLLPHLALGTLQLKSGLLISTNCYNGSANKHCETIGCNLFFTIPQQNSRLANPPRPLSKEAS